MENSAINRLYQTVMLFPDKIFLADGHKELSFRDFFIKACSLRRVLKEQGGINKPVVVYLPKCAEAIIAFAAILLAGHYYVPIDVKTPRKRIADIISTLDPCRIITSRDFQEDMAAFGFPQAKIFFIDDICLKEQGEKTERLIDECQSTTRLIIDTDPCYIMYTSGSTGIPKGVVIPHRGVNDYIDWAVSCLRVSSDDIIGNQAPLHFDNSTLDIYLAWTLGNTLHLISESNFLFPVKVLEYLETHRISFIFFVPSVLVHISKMGLLSSQRLPDLKKIIFAGEVMPAKHLAYWQKNLPGRMFVNLYGPTEITVDCTYFIVDRIYEPNESLPIGYPCQNSGILVLNENDKVAARGEQGELCVRGSSLALGYWKNDMETKKAFVQNPLQDSYFDRIYRTGDIVYVNEKDQIIFVGRKDSQIKHMGYRIELGEIEVAAGSLPFITACCALYDASTREIVLFYEANEQADPSEIRKKLMGYLPAYMIPRKFHFLAKMPLNTNGKIDRRALEKTMMESRT